MLKIKTTNVGINGIKPIYALPGIENNSQAIIWKNDVIVTPIKNLSFFNKSKLNTKFKTNAI